MRGLKLVPHAVGIGLRLRRVGLLPLETVVVLHIGSRIRMKRLGLTGRGVVLRGVVLMVWWRVRLLRLRLRRIVRLRELRLRVRPRRMALGVLQRRVRGCPRVLLHGLWRRGGRVRGRRGLWVRELWRWAGAVRGIARVWREGLWTT